MSKRGNVYLRRMLIHGARAVPASHQVRHPRIGTVGAPAESASSTQQSGRRHRQQTSPHRPGRVVQRRRLSTSTLPCAIASWPWTLRLESTERFTLSHRHDDGLHRLPTGLLRREGDETTVQRRAGKPERSNASLVTEGFKRSGTCESSSRARRIRGRIHLRGLRFAQLQTSCRSAADHTFE